ncbi:MAG TPA: TolC family protein, partial [Verrucomicrobiae bacterium]|nr:TolC family protein [Verrucomicrobiae bacterium]
MDLTGATEQQARGVISMVKAPKPGESRQQNAEPERQPAEPESQEQHRKPKTGARVVIAFLGLSLLGGSAAAAQSTNENIPFITRPISLADAVNIALQQNPSVRRAQKDLEATQGITMQMRAAAVPKFALTGYYNAAQRSDVDIVTSTNFAFGNDQNWQTQIRIQQSVYQGGRINSALRASKLTREQSLLNYQTAAQNVVLDTEIAYFDVLLGHEQVAVEEASVELLSRELKDTTRRYDAGTVPRFNVLRAEVELANAQPRLFRARSNERIAKNNLANLLGFDIPRGALEDIPLNLSGKLAAEPYEIDLPRAISVALEKRTELAALRKGEALRKEDVIAARAGYKPSFQIYGGYDAHNSMLSQDLTDDRHGWIAGIQMSWNIFDGFATKGRVLEARAREESAAIQTE